MIVIITYGKCYFEHCVICTFLDVLGFHACNNQDETRTQVTREETGGRGGKGVRSSSECNRVLQESGLVLPQEEEQEGKVRMKTGFSVSIRQSTSDLKVFLI